MNIPPLVVNMYVSLREAQACAPLLAWFAELSVLFGRFLHLSESFTRTGRPNLARYPFYLRLP